MIKKFRPDVVVGTGGYVCGPVLYAATLMKVPAAIQEQNSYPGVTTRLLAGRVDEVYLTFERSKQYVERARKVFITGNPTRADLGNVPLREALGYFGFSDKERKKTLLVFGGSLGARTINRAMMDCAGRLVGGGLRIVWQTGKEDLDAVKNACSGFPRDSVWIGAFIDRMDCAYAVCDLAVCRAGATTIAELTRLGKPAILVPYPFAAANHQAGNARSLVEAGAALLVCDQEAGARMERSVLELLDDARLKAMSEKSRELGKPDAARDIAKRIISLSDR